MNRTVRSTILANQRGQLLVMWLIFMLPMVALTFSVYNVGVTVSEKMKVQSAADAAAYSAATWNARYLNQTAYINRAMVANYDTIATFTAIWSFVDATDGFVALIRTILRVFFDIGEAITPVAQALHRINDVMSRILGGGNKSPALGRALEAYNQALSVAQQGLYIANQLGRARVAQTIAWGVDPKIQYWLPSEGWNVQEMGNRRDWKESDEEKGLRLTLEHSLNTLSNGESFRDAANFPILGAVVGFIDDIPCVLLKIGPEGFHGPKFNHVDGGIDEEAENLPPAVLVGNSGKVQIAQKDKIYELDHNGIRVGIDCFIEFTLISFGHFSDDKFNLPNAIGLDFPHIIDEEGDHGRDFIERNVECQAAGGSGLSVGGAGAGLAPDAEFTNLQNQFTQNCQGRDENTLADIDGNNQDFPPAPAFPPSARFEALQQHNAVRQARNPPDPPLPASILNDDVSCGDLQSDLEDRQEQLTDGLRDGIDTAGSCATVYEYATPLAEVKVTHYVQKDSIPDGKRVEGPTVVVYVRKQADRLKIFRGLGLRNRADVEAYAFGRSYYTQRPGGGPGDKETAFNPFWAGRLEKAPVFFH
jgi:hypothetical protein